MKKRRMWLCALFALALALALPLGALAADESGDGPVSDDPIVNTDTYSKPAKNAKIAVIKKKANIYANDSFSSDVLKSLTFNKKPTLLGVGKKWYHVKSGSVEGYMAKTSLVRYDSSKKHIALTFDDGPHASNTKIVLDALEKYGCKATFFVVGQNINKTTGKLLKRADSLGCQIANHSYDHPQLSKLKKASIKSQLSRTDDKVLKYIDTKPALLRPPYGAINNTVKSAAARPCILWNVDTLDWKYRDTKRLKNYVPSHASDGSVVLMHDIHPTTAKAVASICSSLKKKGYEMVTVTELAAINGRSLASGYSYSSFKKKK